MLATGNVEPQAIIGQKGETLLHFAAEEGNLEMATLLLAGEWQNSNNLTPLNIDARSTLGHTALFKAAFHGWSDLTSSLLDYGACKYIVQYLYQFWRLRRQALVTVGFVFSVETQHT